MVTRFLLTRRPDLVFELLPQSFRPHFPSPVFGTASIQLLVNLLYH